MKKKLFLFIFFVAFCFIVKPDGYRAEYVGELECYYELDDHQMWLHFIKHNVGEEWEIKKQSNGKYDFWMRYGYSSDLIHLHDYVVSGYENLDKDNPKCPNVAKIDIAEKKIELLEENIYYLSSYGGRNYGDKNGSFLNCLYRGRKGNQNHEFKINWTPLEENEIYWKGYIYSLDGYDLPEVRSTYVTSFIETRFPGKMAICPLYVKIEDEKISLEGYDNFLIKKRVGNSIRYGEASPYIELTDNKLNAMIELTITDQDMGYGGTCYELSGGNPYDRVGSVDLNCRYTYEKYKESISYHFEGDFDGNLNESDSSYVTWGYFVHRGTGKEFDTFCFSYTDKEECEANYGASEERTHACVWNEEYNFCNASGLTYLKCGGSHDIPEIAPTLISYAVTLLKVATPLILIFVSLISLVKAISAQKEDEIKKAQNKLVKNIITSVLVFFVIQITQFVILKAADSGEHGDIKNCLSCMLNNDCDGSVYFKDGYGFCHYVDDIYTAVKCDT